MVLVPWVGKRIAFDGDTPWVRESGTRSHAYLDGARSGWTDHPEYMDFLDPASPVYALKRMERDLYLHHWGPHLHQSGPHLHGPRLDGVRVLDVGSGIGRFTCPLLDRGATVHAADADLESLRRLVWHSAGREGRIDVSWTDVHHLPEVTVDLAIAAEVLCYVPDAALALKSIARRVRAGGTVLLSLEARYGWAAAQDAPRAIEAALDGDGVVDVPGDRWVRTCTRDDVISLLGAAGLVVDDVVASHWLPDGPLEDTMPAEITLPELVALEDRCRQHPVWAPLNRLWLAAAHVP